MLRLLKILCADTAAHDRNHGKAHCVADDAADSIEIVGHRIGRDMHSAEQRDHRNDQHPAKLEQAVLKRRGMPM